MKRVAVYGASGFGREVMPLVRRQLTAEKESFDLVFIDDQLSTEMVNGHAVLTYESWLRQDATARYVVLAIANSEVREKLAQRCTSDGVQFLHLQAENVMVLDAVEMGTGAILCPFVSITSNVKIGRQFHANIYSYVAHDCVIGDFVTFAPGVHCNGNVVIEDHAYIGTGAILRQGKPGAPLVIGKGAIVGMGAVVTKSVSAGATVVGNPARVMRSQ